MLRRKITSSGLHMFFLRPIKLLPGVVKKADRYMGPMLSSKFLAAVQGLGVTSVQDMGEIV